MNEDICIPRSEMPMVISEIKQIAKKRGIKVVNFAHAGDGNIHVNFMYNGSNEAETANTHLAVEDLFHLTLAHGGTLSGEHGIGKTKSQFLSFEYGNSETGIMRRIKNLFDPDGILNPGKIFSGDL
jgi:FAD/FMN-containing dehydrogenase